MTRVLQDTRTAENLQSAFAGESMANRKYLYFARIARKLGAEEIAELFEDTARQETAHAFAHLELIYPESEMNIEKLLEAAIVGELYETNQMYPEFEKVAREEGNEEAIQEFQKQAEESKVHAEVFQDAAKRFKALGVVEKYHAGRYQQALDKYKESESE